ncbi:MAG TPA: hypothetical protein VKA70_00785 [Blastocatellia bacterium]|nr:hypothetical protein [Blastocatellia bacterium]
MKKRNPLSQGSRPIVIATILFFLALLAIYTVRLEGKNIQEPSSRNELKKQELMQLSAKLKETFKVEDLKIDNQTSAFAIQGIEKTPAGHIKLTLMNNTDKKITAYQISLGITSEVKDSMLATYDESIAPGALREIMWLLAANNEIESRGLVIHAVLFDDGTSDGNQNVINELHDYRIGQEIQMDYTLGVLDSTLNVSDERLVQEIDAAKTSLFSYSGKSTGDALPMWVKLGIEHTEKIMSHHIDNIKQKSGKATREALSQLVKYTREKITGLKTYLERSERQTRSRGKIIQ